MQGPAAARPTPLGLSSECSGRPFAGSIDATTKPDTLTTVERSLEPEILDSLPPRHPDAVHGRRDLRRINLVMGNFRWFARALLPLLQPGDRVLDLGAGDGRLIRHLAGAWQRRRGGEIPPRFAGLDIAPAPPDWPSTWEWHQCDLVDFDRFEDYRVVLGNLFFHHFNTASLRSLGYRMQHGVELFLASEPARRRVHLWQLRLLIPLRLNPVTWHDARVSIAAGFLADDLPKYLGLPPDNWSWRCKAGAFGSYRMVARRRPCAAPAPANRISQP